MYMFLLIYNKTHVKIDKSIGFAIFFKLKILFFVELEVFDILNSLPEALVKIWPCFKLLPIEITDRYTIPYSR